LFSLTIISLFSISQWLAPTLFPGYYQKSLRTSLVLSNSGQVTIILSGLQGKNLWYRARLWAHELIADKGKILSIQDHRLPFQGQWTGPGRF
jgi:hypothetical protein